ncbi:MAG: SCO family protein [Rhodocyclaceae bacterium]|nr:SCO family protein [Rhodocyclaceae bacterium]
MKGRLGTLLLLVGLALAAAGGYLASRALTRGPLPAGAPPRAFTLLDDERPVPDFALQKPQGIFTQADLTGKWTLIFFGYTHCPDVCPTAMTLLKELRRRLASGGTPLPQVVFVSVDALRDTPALLGQYVPAFDPAFVGVTGSDEALAPLTKHLGVFFQRNSASGDPRNYTVDHSAAIYLIDPAGRLKAVFSPPQQVERMTQDYLSLISR